MRHREKEGKRNKTKEKYTIVIVRYYNGIDTREVSRGERSGYEALGSYERYWRTYILFVFKLRF
jgi:hypothetical protein